MDTFRNETPRDVIIHLLERKRYSSYEQVFKELSSEGNRVWLSPDFFLTFDDAYAAFLVKSRPLVSTAGERDGGARREVHRVCPFAGCLHSSFAGFLCCFHPLPVAESAEAASHLSSQDERQRQQEVISSLVEGQSAGVATGDWLPDIRGVIKEAEEALKVKYGEVQFCEKTMSKGKIVHARHRMFHSVLGTRGFIKSSKYNCIMTLAEPSSESIRLVKGNTCDDAVFLCGYVEIHEKETRSSVFSPCYAIGTKRSGKEYFCDLHTSRIDRSIGAEFRQRIRFVMFGLLDYINVKSGGIFIQDSFELWVEALRCVLSRSHTGQDFKFVGGAFIRLRMTNELILLCGTGRNRMKPNAPLCLYPFCLARNHPRAEEGQELSSMCELHSNMCKKDGYQFDPAAVAEPRKTAFILPSVIDMTV